MAGRAARRRPTLRDVSELAKVDASIVSRVLNGEARRVAPATHQRILDVVEQLNYEPNPIARSLSVGRTQTLGMLIPDLRNLAYGNMILGAEQASAESDHVLIFASTGDDETVMNRQLERLAPRVDGLIVASVLQGGGTRDALSRLRIPFILLNRRGPGRWPAVVGDDEAGVTLAVEHLAGLGHRRIGHISGPARVDTIARRRKAFVAATTHLAPARDDCPVVRAAAIDAEAGADAMERLLTRRGRRRPTAVFCVALVHALGAMRRALDLGVRVPEDVSIVAFDDAPVADYLATALTTVRMPHAAMGRRAAELLLGSLDGEPPPSLTVIDHPPELIVRNSTAAPAA
jgi:LacI family transcriptional regulator